MSAPRSEQCSVLIVGGGPTGLIASVLLGRLGVSNILIDKHPSTSLFPKARKLNTRTMEILRVLGLEAEVRTAAEQLGDIPLMLGGETLAGQVRLRIAGEPYDDGTDRSPTTWAFCAQNRLEPILRSYAERQPGSDVRFGCEITDVEQDADGVTASVCERSTAARSTIRADYAIAADGAHSFVRDALGIGTSGPGDASEWLNILFRADLETVRGSNRSMLFNVRNEMVEGIIGMSGEGDWILLCPDVPEPTRDRCTEMIRLAAGVSDLPVEILALNHWQRATRIADRFHSGRVFLAGDAAHRLIPSGAFGLNTGVQDSHNLAWKLAMVTSGCADPHLLDSYELERRPVAARNVELSQRFWESGTGAALGYVLGFAYERGAVVPDGTGPPHLDDPVSDYVPNARPGSRAPHWWLEGRMGGPSSIDLFDRDFVLITREGDEVWSTNVVESAGAGMPIRHVRLSPGPWVDLCGVGPSGAVLVRPDGHVAWRVRSLTGPERARQELRSALDALY